MTNLEQTALLHLPALVDHLQGDIIEIGSFKGKSTTALGLGSKWISERKRSIYAIDPFIPDGAYHGNYFNDFEKNIKEVQLENYVTPIKHYSHEAITECPELISALFVDGNHNYLNVKQDIQLYTPRVVAGGMIAFHDYSIYLDVQRAVDELCESKEYVYVCDYDSLRLIRKLN
ncbi:class I SAM-dependent methyltransferase [Peribacillus butanolivorans]|uniref:class I SAM-dependent methyltransferase n=1 Tax=Peribacillus butanolivorans TaxID=421767 RepID=UPI003D29B85D